MPVFATGPSARPVSCLLRPEWSRLRDARQRYRAWWSRCRHRCRLRPEYCCRKHRPHPPQSPGPRPEFAPDRRQSRAGVSIQDALETLNGIIGIGQQMRCHHRLLLDHGGVLLDLLGWRRFRGGDDRHRPLHSLIESENVPACSRMAASDRRIPHTEGDVGNFGVFEDMLEHGPVRAAPDRETFGQAKITPSALERRTARTRCCPFSSDLVRISPPSIRSGAGTPARDFAADLPRSERRRSASG